jgi:hypothetical protein
MKLFIFIDGTKIKHKKSKTNSKHITKMKELILQVEDGKIKKKIFFKKM